LQRTRPLSASDAENENPMPSGREKVAGRQGSSLLGLSMEEIKVLRQVREENERRGGFIRIFPTPLTWDLYGSFLEHKTSMNYMLATCLFPDRAALSGRLDMRLEAVSSHAPFYERKLVSLESRKHRRRHGKARAARTRSSGTSQPTNLSLKSVTEDEEEEDVNADEELDRTAGSRSDTQVKSKPKLSDLVKTTGKERLPKKLDKKTGDGGELCLRETDSESPFNLLQILQKHGNLSKVQARRAFSAYLQHVQFRLMEEAGDQIQNAAWAAKENEQMELVVRFLKRAAGNLQQSLRMLLPSRCLSLNDRRRILAHQLGKFIICYNKETEQMARKQSKKKQEEEEEGVNPEGFQNFLTRASESDLEEVLTFYTHKNKSTSVFLGTSSTSTKASNTSNQTEKQPQEEHPEVVRKIKGDRPKSSVADLPAEGALKGHKSKEVKSTSKLPPCGSPSASSSVSGATFKRTTSSWITSQPAASENSQATGHHSLWTPPVGPRLIQAPSPVPSSQSTAPDSSSVFTNPLSSEASSLARLHHSHSGSYTIGPFSSFQRAAQIYSQRLSRPSSAKAGEYSGLHQNLLVQYRDYAEDSSPGKRYNPSMVAAELRQLAEKQAAPPSPISLLTQQLTNLNLASGAISQGNAATPQSYGSPLKKRGALWAVHTPRADKRSVSSAVRAPENHCVAWEREMENRVCNKVTQNVLAHPTYQLHFAVQQLQQQKLQSQQLVEQSQARHQAPFASYSQSSSSRISMPAGSDAHKIASATCSTQKAASSHKAVPSQSTPSQLVPKPPANHRQAVVRKAAAQRISQ
ncbi:TTLL5 polyglutamylase, partial [Bucorvus abyssinicus]|nr:TTLL5 polyglutamylase [Bucorvus abyssinicus]